MKPTYLMLLWHMHQPFYKDLVDDIYIMPWVRLHALKDYFGMIAILGDFPSVHVTFNLVPSLVVQLEDYAKDRAREPAYDIAFKPVAELTSEERETLTVAAFQLNRENLLNRYPRFQELSQKVNASGSRLAASLLTSQDLLDLQVLSQLAWFDEIYLRGDSYISGLVAKERGYTENDKSLLRKKEIELINKVLEEYRVASERGQIELSTSPFYHPILPLLCDSNVAAESHPGIKLPRRRFIHHEDARDQLREAIVLHQRVFGQRPRGLWPSEGSVSDAVLRLAAEEGFKWTATDEGVLGRSLKIAFYRMEDGTLSGGQELYRPHRFLDGNREVALFFRDHQLSDLIGFVYSRMDAEAAAADLHRRIRAAGRSTGQRPAVISIILDGENAWEFYPGNGREFLKTFYEKLASDPELRTVTPSEALELTEPGTLTHLVPGSWIDANFDIWIGAEEDNRAWDLLSEARDFFAEKAQQASVAPEDLSLATQELWIAEGSDWCWWYGPEHSTANDEEFDFLFRKHLSNVYRLLKSSPPDELAIPIKRPKVAGRQTTPSGPIEPCVDGKETSYFEWLGAGSYKPEDRSGSMHGGTHDVEALYYGWNEQALYLRVDLNNSFTSVNRKFEIRLNVSGLTPVRVHSLVEQGRAPQVKLWRGDDLMPTQAENGVLVAFGRIFELRLDWALTGTRVGDRVRLQASLWVNELPVQALPREGWITFELTDDRITW